MNKTEPSLVGATFARITAPNQVRAKSYENLALAADARERPSAKARPLLKTAVDRLDRLGETLAASRWM